MERIIQLIGGAAGLGAFSWVLWPGMSSHDTGMMVMSVLVGLAAGVCGFLAVAKAMHASRWTAALFWVAMLGGLLYLFPPLGVSPHGWIAFGGLAFLAVLSIAVVVGASGGEAGQAGRRRGVLGTYRPMGENGWDDGVNYTGYPTNKAVRMGLDTSPFDDNR